MDMTDWLPLTRLKKDKVNRVNIVLKIKDSSQEDGFIFTTGLFTLKRKKGSIRGCDYRSEDIIGFKYLEDK